MGARDRAARDRAKGLAIRNQRALWERTLELRILLQRCLQVQAEGIPVIF
jgi:protein AATF/BFR2